MRDIRSSRLVCPGYYQIVLMPDMVVMVAEAVAKPDIKVSEMFQI